MTYTTEQTTNNKIKQLLSLRLHFLYHICVLQCCVFHKEQNYWFVKKQANKKITNKINENNICAKKKHKKNRQQEIMTLKLK